jgi:LCP family protein required for cell wall assembly
VHPVAPRWAWISAVGVAALLLPVIAVGVDVLTMTHRIDRIDLAMPSAKGETWVIVGSDSRETTPDVGYFGSVDDVGGARADVIVVVHKEAGETTVLTIPRDLVVGTGIHRRRLTLAFLEPQEFVDALCSNLGIGADHLAVVNMRAFASLVDATGGIEVNFDVPLRDQKSGLAINEAGTQQLDGNQTLALVRSRSSEALVGDEWIANGQAAGAEQRAEWTARVFGYLAANARAQVLNPFAARGLIETVASELTVSAGTSLLDLVRASMGEATSVRLPVFQSDDTHFAWATVETLDVLSHAGFAPGG